MAAYAVAHMRQVTMGPQIVEYLQRIDATLEPFGGRFLVHGGDMDVVENEWPGHLIVIEFPDRAHAWGWYDSSAYRDSGLAHRQLPRRCDHRRWRSATAQGDGRAGIGANYRFSKNTACWPKKFQNHHGIDRPIFWPLPSSAVAFSTEAPSSSTRLTKSRMVQKWMLGVSYQE